MRRIVSVFFSLVFVLLITAPTLISLVESTFDVSVFFNINEEENQENESNKKIEVEFTDSQESGEYVNASEKGVLHYHYFESYSRFYLKLHSPPPEQV